MTRVLLVGLLVALAAGACTRPGQARRFEIRGQVVAVDPSRNELTLKHDEVKGFMPAMTMPFKVLDGVGDLVAGDLVAATLVVEGDAAHLEGIRKIGSASLAPPVELPSASSGFELLEPGDEIPDVTFVDQDGRNRRMADTRGRALALTFIYTRCPLPTFCPAMDRNFAAVQRRIATMPALRGKVQLLSISFDPAYDTPAVLKKHAQGLGAEPSVWNFVTGDRDEIDRFAARFGVSVTRSQTDDRDITHNLRTAVVGPDGKLIKVYTGYDWTPLEIIQDLGAISGT
jgi:protein SCO1/2